MASRGVNKVILVGNVGKDPIVTPTTNSKVAKFSLGISENRRNPQTGAWDQQETEWVNVTAWGRTAEVVEQYVRKGMQVYVEGRLHTSSYEKNGEKKYSTEVVVSDLMMLGRRSDNPGIGTGYQGGGSAPGSFGGTQNQGGFGQGGFGGTQNQGGFGQGGFGGTQNQGGFGQGGFGAAPGQGGEAPMGVYSGQKSAPQQPSFGQPGQFNRQPNPALGTGSSVQGQAYGTAAPQGYQQPAPAQNNPENTDEPPISSSIDDNIPF